VSAAQRSRTVYASCVFCGSTLRCARLLRRVHARRAGVAVARLAHGRRLGDHEAALGGALQRGRTAEQARQRQPTGRRLRQSCCAATRAPGCSTSPRSRPGFRPARATASAARTPARSASGSGARGGGNRVSVTVLASVQHTAHPRARSPPVAQQEVCSPKAQSQGPIARRGLAAAQSQSAKRGCGAMARRALRRAKLWLSFRLPMVKPLKSAAASSGTASFSPLKSNDAAAAGASAFAPPPKQHCSDDVRHARVRWRCM
jgi:hypothetical protein